MDVREKLVELLEGIQDYGFCRSKKEEPQCRVINRIVIDYLISQGVTVQEWISVKDRLPEYNVDVLVYRPNMAMKIIVDSYDGYYGEDDGEWHEGWRKYGKDIHNNPLITHWQPMPQPPKGE